jgi:hypothetical protein
MAPSLICAPFSMEDQRQVSAPSCQFIRKTQIFIVRFATANNWAAYHWNEICTYINLRTSHSSRVTKLGEFSPIELLFTWDSSLKIYINYINFDKNGLGYILAFFSKTDLVILQPRIYVGMYYMCLSFLSSYVVQMS